ncbi:MAG: DNA polymerase III subunit gamma/tau [Acidobacteriota bacterium]|nr:DNA polymerase III subunit gamma/tau [Acidobacteriota bacterium]
MTYQALARKSRPQDFSSIIGQEAVVTALKNAISEDRIAQAYLFSGIRGVGKTTAARVFAKALNCENRETSGGDPCNACGTCTEITRGADLDVLEIDAATYSKVEQVRELAESLRYGPARDPYKVVVIDEIHRLSRQAFDALLKIVEEPPAHLVFVFATTEIEVVPATILSRCQEFHFRRVPAAEVARLLQTLCESEQLEASERALRLIARAGEGSVRDSVALLDQLGTFGSGKVAEEDAVRLLGGLDLRLYLDLLRSILAGESAAVSNHLRSIESLGWDPRRTHGQFLSYCRSALHAAVGADPDQLDLPTEDAAALVELATATGYENVLRLLNQLLKSEELVRRSDTPALAVEVAWLRAAELPKLIAIEDLLGGGGGTPAGRDGGDAPTAKASPARPKAAPPVATTAPAAPAALDEPPPEGPRLSSDPRQAFLELVSQRKQPLAARLRQCQKLAFRDGQLTVILPPGDPLLQEALERAANREILDDAVRKAWGENASWKLEIGEAPAQDAADVDAAASSVPEHPVVQSALDLFAGTIETIEETPTAKE